MNARDVKIQMLNDHLDSHRLGDAELFDAICKQLIEYMPQVCGTSPGVAYLAYMEHFVARALGSMPVQDTENHAILRETMIFRMKRLIETIEAQKMGVN